MFHQGRKWRQTGDAFIEDFPGIPLIEPNQPIIEMNRPVKAEV
jgi:hypothetical protein